MDGIVKRVTAAVVLIALLGVAACDGERPPPSLVTLGPWASDSTRVYFHLASTGAAMAVYMDKFQTEFYRRYWGRWTRRGADYMLEMREVQRHERQGVDEVAGRVTKITPPLRIELLEEEPMQYRVRCDNPGDLHGLTVRWSRENTLTESQLTAEFRPVQPGVQEEVGMEGSR